MKKVIIILVVAVNLLSAQTTTRIKAPIAADKLPSGDLFVVTESSGVHRFRVDDGKLSPVGSFSLPTWQVPSDIVSAIANGQPAVFVAALAPSRGYVYQYALDGKPRETWSTGHILAGLDFDPRNDTVYVATYDSGEIYEASITDHKHLLHYFSQVMGGRQLGPLIVDTSRNQLLVGDVQDGAIYSVNIKTHKSRLLASGFGSPQALLLSADRQQLFVADAPHRKIYRLDLSKSGAAPKTFSEERVYKEPVGLALLSSGDIVVADDRADALFIVSPSGSLATKVVAP